MFEKNVLGSDAFVWAIGVVEGRQDPLALGRVQVRAYNIHTSSLTDIPSSSLPWAQVVNSANLKLVEGDTVLLFFADGASCQFPIILAKLEGFQVVPNNQGQGFNDLRPASVLQNAPRPPSAWNYASNGAGITVTSPNTASPNPLTDELGAPSLSGATRFDIANTVIQQRINNLDTNIVTATGLTWSEPYPAYNPLYPYNKAEQSESGHILEVDDTPGNERLARTHRTGTFDEIYPSGTKVQKITKSNYSIVMGDDYLHVMGRVLITVGEGAYIKVLGNVNIEADNALNLGVAGDLNVSVGGAFNVKAQSINMSSQESTIVSNDILLTGDVDVSGSAAIGGGIQVQGSSALDGTVSIGSILSGGINPGARPAESAESGSAASVPAAPSIATPNSGMAGIEPTPTPWVENYQYLTPYTATQVKQNMFLVQSANGSGNVAPDANANTVACSYDANVHTFLSSDVWAISNNGIIALQQREGLATLLANGMCQAYPDPILGPALLTIRYGTTSVVLPSADALTTNTVISIPTCQQYLLDAINNIFLPYLQQVVSVNLTQNMIDALLSFMYNIGTGNFGQSSVLKFTNQQQYCSAGQAFLLWNKAGGVVVPGLTTRRQQESSQYLT